jgi:hypothetical protein
VAQGEVVREVEGRRVDVELPEVHPEVEGDSETVAEVEVVVDLSQAVEEDREEVLCQGEVASEGEDKGILCLPAFPGVRWLNGRNKIHAPHGLTEMLP